MRKYRQYSRLRHHILGYLPSQFLNFRQVAEGIRDRAEIFTRVIELSFNSNEFGREFLTKPSMFGKLEVHASDAKKGPSRIREGHGEGPCGLDSKVNLASVRYVDEDGGVICQNRRMYEKVMMV